MRELTYPGFASAVSSECRINGIDMPCGLQQRLMNAGALGEKYKEALVDRGSGKRPTERDIIPLGLGLYKVEGVPIVDGKELIGHRTEFFLGHWQPQRNTPIDPNLKKSIEDCAKEMYKVTAKGTGFIPTRRGVPGSFNGSRIDRDGKEEEVHIVNENTVYDGRKLMEIALSQGGQIVESGKLDGLTIGSEVIAVNMRTGEVKTIETGYSPYRNFTAKDLTGRSWVGVQTWELGNSLSLITKKWGHFDNMSHREPGKLFTDCVRRKYGRPF